MSEQKFWRGKRVFITGHTGFKGSWLCLWLSSLGAKITGYALNPPTNPSLFELAQVVDLIDSRVGDVRNAICLQQIILETQPEIVIHLAAQPLVRDSYHIPVETFATNVMGVVNLMESVRSCPSVRAVVNVTTDKCYENKEWVWGYRENDPMGGYDPYSSSKGCSELVTASYRNSFFNPLNSNSSISQHNAAIASARAGNVIGGGDWANDRLIPDCIRALLAGEVIRIRNPHAIRPWQHVLEPLSGYLTLAQHLYEGGNSFSEGWNFGPMDMDAKSVGWIAKRMCDLWGKGACCEIDGSEHPHEAHYLKLDCSKARMHLGWQPKWSLEYSIAGIVEWVKVYSRGGDLKEICLKQIEEYESLQMLES